MAPLSMFTEISMYETDVQFQVHLDIWNQHTTYEWNSSLLIDKTTIDMLKKLRQQQ
jgi:hypothetical protein